MSPALYQPLFLALMAIISVVVAVRHISSEGYALQEAGSGLAFPLALSVVVTFWIGLRPVSFYFGDTVNYAMEYVHLSVSAVSMDWHSEWIWQWLMMSCKAVGLNVHLFFLLIETLYVMSAFWAVKRLMPSNPLLGMLFVFLSLMYFTFSVNGMRNGLACHLLLLAFSFLLGSKYAIGAVLCLVAFGIHRSVALPIASFLAACYAVKNVRYAIYFWLSSIILSLLAGGAFTNFFASLGFDDRMQSYTHAGSIDMSQFCKVGFRWDFLLYSAMPVFMVWYVSVKRGIEENWYRVIATTYCLSNAFWVLVIRSEFSNRFAYLSWFLYPIVIAYPLVNMPVWDGQDRKTGQILLAYGGFNILMNTLYW